MEKVTDISARIAEIIKNKGVTPNSFAKSLGYSRAQTVYDILNSKCAPSYDFFKRFAKSDFSAFVNLQWLLTGEGEMFKPDTQNADAPETSPLAPLCDIIKQQAETIRQQAEQIGELRALLAKTAPNADNAPGEIHAPAV